jgi:hypothetical protein
VTDQRTERQRTDRPNDPNQQSQRRSSQDDDRQAHRPVSVSEHSEEVQPEELKEYHYYIGYIETTAMLTEEMAEQLDAKPVDEPLDEPTLETNTERRGSVQAPGVTKARNAPRNKQR